MSADRVSPKLVAAAAKVLAAAMGQGNREPYSLAFVLDSACLLQSPETADEARQLRDDVAGACLARWEEEQENARLRLAWRSARERAQAYGEGILRVVADREAYQGWLKQEQAVTQQLRARVAKLEAERHTTNEALSDAAEALRVQRDRIAELETAPSRTAVLREAAEVARVEGERLYDEADVEEAKAAWGVGILLDRMADEHDPLHHPTAGELAEQRHLVDPLDHALEALAPRTEEVPELATQQCGYDDYHDPHPWHDRPHFWCPGHSYETTTDAGSAL